MNFLKDVLREKKLIEVQEEIEDFLEKNDISDDAIIYKIELGKERFKTEEEAREYLASKWFWDYSIEETETAFVAIAIPDEQIRKTDMQIQIGRDAVGFIADFVSDTRMEDMIFNDKGELKFSSKFGVVKLSEGMPHIIEIAKVAEGVHPLYGKVSITQKDLESIVSNFNDKVTGTDLPINEDHAQKEAFGWVKDVFLSFDKQTLYGQIHWNTKGITALAEKEYRYFSPEIHFNYEHQLSGEKHGVTLLGGALTNYPFLKMDAITNLNHKKSKGENVDKTIELSVHNETVVELNNKIIEATSKLAVTESKNVELNDKVKTLETEIEKSKKETVHQKLFDSNKINKAQFAALNEGKTMLEVLELNTKMNTESQGAGGVDVITDLSNEEKRIAKSLDLSDKEFAEYNK